MPPLASSSRPSRPDPLITTIKYTIAGVVALFLLITAMSSFHKVPVGEVGIRVNNWGSARGVENYPVLTGRVFLNPFTEDLFKFPTTKVTVIWTRDSHEGTAHDESITFNSIEGAVVNADVGVTLSIQRDKVPALFVAFKQDADALVHGYVRNQVRDEIGRRASQMKVTDIFGVGKAALQDSVLSDLRRKLGPLGFDFDNISFVGAFRVDESVNKSINATLQAKQEAIAAESRVAQSKAEAEQMAARAQGFADSVRIVTDAQAAANQKMNATLTPQLVKWQAVQRWDGVLPKVSGNVTPFVSVNDDKEK